MLDDRVRAVLARMEEEDADDIARGLPTTQRSLPVGPDTGRLLFALVAPNPGCEVLEIGASRGYSTIWLAAGARMLDGRVVSLEQDPVKCETWRRNIADAGLEEHAELVEGDAYETIPRLDTSFDVVLLDAWKDDYEALFALARPLLERGSVVVADNATDASPGVKAYSAARQADPGFVSVTVPLGNGLEVTTVLSP
jgi:predicted O-methyltransferase YrrM